MPKVLKLATKTANKVNQVKINYMKSGIELIATERQEQLTKHNRSIELDVKHNHGQYEKDGEQFNNPQLPHAAGQLLYQDDDIFRQHHESEIFHPHEFMVTVCKACHELEEIAKREIVPLIRKLTLSGVTYQQILYHLKALQ